MRNSIELCGIFVCDMAWEVCNYLAGVHAQKSFLQAQGVLHQTLDITPDTFPIGEVEKPSLAREQSKGCQVMCSQSQLEHQREETPVTASLTKTKPR